MRLNTYNCPKHGDRDLWVDGDPDPCGVDGCTELLAWVPTTLNLGGDLHWFGSRKCGYDDIQLGYVKDRTHYHELTKDCEIVTKPKYESTNVRRKDGSDASDASTIAIPRDVFDKGFRPESLGRINATIKEPGKKPVRLGSDGGIV